MNPEAAGQADLRRWSVAELKRAVENADTDRKLAPFNDVITGEKDLSPELKKHLVLRDVSLGGKMCDVYHWDQDENGQKIPDSSAHRIFIHIKE